MDVERPEARARLRPSLNISKESGRQLGVRRAAAASLSKAANSEEMTLRLASRLPVAANEHGPTPEISAHRGFCLRHRNRTSPTSSSAAVRYGRKLFLEDFVFWATLDSHLSMLLNHLGVEAKTLTSPSYPVSKIHSLTRLRPQPIIESMYGE